MVYSVFSGVFLIDIQFFFYLNKNLTVVYFSSDSVMLGRLFIKKEKVSVICFSSGGLFFSSADSGIYVQLYYGLPKDQSWISLTLTWMTPKLIIPPVRKTNNMLVCNFS